MSTEQSDSKLWGGRFTESTDAEVERFTESVSFDRRLYRQDIHGSIAHATMLQEVGILSDEEAQAIVAGLHGIANDIEDGRFHWSTAREDVHMNIEAALIERIGEVGKKLHTGRSRNDQIATDVRLWLREEIDALLRELHGLRCALVDFAAQEIHTVAPGFTHLQSAQPISLGHHTLAWFEMLSRDAWRLRDARARLNYCPLGAAALAGTSFPIDRARTAQALDFSAPLENSIDAVSDRDFAIEFVSDASLLMVHLSRMAEELVLWSSSAFGFVEIGDAFCTGSSIMPQKKNPDIPELVRGKSARVLGHLGALLTLMKGQPLAYNRDNQEDKEPLFDTVDTVRGSVRVFAAMIPSITVNREQLRAAATQGYSTATDLADYLVRQGVAFRDAHEAVGRTVRYAIDEGRGLAELSLNELQQFCPVVEADVHKVLSVEGSLASRDHFGATAPAQVQAAVARARNRLREEAPPEPPSPQPSSSR